MRRHVLALLACTLAVSPAHALTRYGCIQNISQTTWTIPADWGNPSLIETVTAGGGAAQSVAPSTVGNAAGGGLDAAIGNTAVTPGATVQISIGVGGAAGINGLDQGNGTNAGVSGTPTFVCKVSSCPSGYSDTNTAVGGQGGLWGATSYDPVNGASCGSAKWGGPGGWCNNGGNTSGVFEASSAGGGGAPGGGGGGLGPNRNLSGSFGGGAGGGSCRGASCGAGTGGAASGAAGGAGGTAGTGGVVGGNGGTSGATTYGQAGLPGVTPSGYPSQCLGPGSAGGAPSADNVSTDPASATGNPDGGYPGGGGASGNTFGGGQGPGKGANGEILFQYTSTGIGVLHNPPQGYVF